MWTFFVFFGNRRGEGARKIANAVGGEKETTLRGYSQKLRVSRKERKTETSELNFKKLTAHTRFDP